MRALHAGWGAGTNLGGNMCLSPDEMSTRQIEEVVEYYRERCANGRGNLTDRWHLEEYEKLLKERAENGTY